jgi:hypothetical protein
MKANILNFKIKSGEKCSYRVTIPLQVNQNLSSSELSEYKIEVYSDDKIIELRQQEKSYYFERTDGIGKYNFNVQLKLRNKQIEEQSVIISIKDELPHEIFLNSQLPINFLNSPPAIEIDDQDFYNSIKEIINSTDIKVGSRSYGWGVPGSTPIGVDNNSEVIFKDLKKINRDEDIIEVICQLINEQTTSALLIWKCITMLKHFRAINAIGYVQPIAKKSYENKSETRFLHEECIKYLESVNSIKNRETVIKQLMYFALECVTPEARTAALSSIIKTGKRNDEIIIQFILRVNEIETHLDTRLTAVSGLANFNLTDHIEAIEGMLQDAETKVREKISIVLLNNSLKINFDLLVNIFEEETDKSVRVNICKLLFKSYNEEAKPFIIKVLGYEDEDYTNTVLDSLIYEKDTKFLIPTITSYKNFESYSDSLNKKIDDFIKKHSV